MGTPVNAVPLLVTATPFTSPSALIVAVAAADLAIFLDKPQGVAEHIGYVVTAEKKLEELSSAKGKLELLKKL